MNHYSNTDIKLANYLYDDMGPEEMVDFEQELLNSPELSESYRINTKVKEYLKAKVVLEEMKSDSSLVEAERLAESALSRESDTQEPRKNEKKNTGRRQYKITYILAIAAVVTIGIIIRSFVPFTDTERLYITHYEPLNAPDYIQRNELNGSNQLFSEAINWYKQGNYEQSTLLFNQLDELSNHAPEINLYKGLNHLGLEQYDVAEKELDTYIKGNSRYLPEALWYFSLCCLKNGDIEKARFHLEQLTAYEGKYKKDAQSLVRKLRRMK